jgi:hypothetical protein
MLFCMRKAVKAVKPLRGMSDPRHGTPSGYGYWGCRCGECRVAAREKARADRTGVVTDHSRYGYDKGCRCQVCRAAKKAVEDKRNTELKEWKRTRSHGPVGKVNLSDLA